MIDTLHEYRLGREFEFTLKDFYYLRTLMHEVSGIHLSDAKQEMVYSRLARRLRHLGFKTFAQYCRYLQEEEHDELIHAINAITTNLTHFFREKHHFESLRTEIIPEILSKQPRGKRLRIWSAGCSTGEEPYSVAMILSEFRRELSDWDIRILATDLDTNVLNHCRAGIYERSRVEPIPDATVKRWFKPIAKQPEYLKIDHNLQEQIAFKRLNLIRDWPFKGPFDVIFCRNVVIYFDKPTQQRLYRRLHEKLGTGGYLFLGHSEQLGAYNDKFEPLGKTTFRKVG